MRSPRILILYNEPILPAHHPDAESEHEILYTVEVVSKTLVQAGFEVSRLGVSRDPGVLLAGLRDPRPDAVFNLFEGTADQGHTDESAAASLLEWFGVPFTGCPAQALRVARAKHLAKYLFQGAGLPTPEFFVVQESPVPDCPIDWPVIVKPALEDASVGLDQGSVVTSQPQLNERVAHVLQTYGPPVLVEKFIRGREFNVGLIEAPDLKVLPVSEVEFVDKDPSYWPIVTYHAKWTPGSRDYEATPPRYPADISPKLAERLAELARQAFRLLGCRDYARVDFRVRPSGKPYILEVNPNPDFSPMAGLSGGLTSAGLTHAQFTVDLVRAALARGSKKALATAVAPEMEPQCRDADPADGQAIRRIVEGCGIFRTDEVGASLELIEAALEKQARSAYHCLILEGKDGIAGAACLGKAPRTDGTYHLYWIAVAPPCQGQGLGHKLLLGVEAWIRQAGGKVVIAEASAQQSHIQARQFYLRRGFRLVGDVPDFYREGDSRLTYAKYLGTPR
jgi:D-alanine-D-alanine ligase